MYKAMIVEDEMLVRIGLRNIIDWKALDIVLIEDAANGKKAMEIYEQEHPDIILTDIRMPEMDGLTLIQAIRERDDRCRFIILTCVEDFEIAQKAISYNVSGYLLKLTMSFEEIQKIVCKAIGELRKISAPVSHVRTADAAAVKQRFLKDFLFYNSCSGQELQEYISSYGLKLRQGYHVVGILSLLSYQNVKEQYDDQNGDLVTVSILNVLQELIESTFLGEVFHDTGADYVMVLCLPSADWEENEKILESFRVRVQEIMKIYFDTRVLLYFSSFHDKLEQLPVSYQEALQISRQHFYIDQPQSGLQNESDLLMKFRSVMEERKQSPILDVLLEDEEKATYIRQIESVQDTLPSPGEIRALFANLAELATYFACNRWGFRYLDQLKLHFSSIQSIGTLDMLAQQHQQYLEQIFKYACPSVEHSPEITQALAYISEHYTEDISLQTLADYVHLSANYFSNLFKKEMQQRFVDYVNELRIECAKRLLLTSSKRTVQISEETGFSDTTYFSKVFKKMVGISPAEYRKIHTGMEEIER